MPPPCRVMGLACEMRKCFEDVHQNCGRVPQVYRMCNLSLVLANAGNCGAGMGDGVMFSMKPLLLLGTGDCGLAPLLAGLYWREV